MRQRKADSITMRMAFGQDSQAGEDGHACALYQEKRGR